MKKNNNLIAEFMGMVIQPNECDRLFRYHKDWGWLMPVVDKIDDTSSNNFKGFYFGFSRYSAGVIGVPRKEGERITEVVEVGDCKSRLDATYQIVVKFIEWYNENEKS